MSRSGYDEDYDQGLHAMYLGQLRSAMRGKRGQQFFRDLVAALDAMPEKRLIKEELQCPDGMCAMGAVGAHRGLDLKDVDPLDPEWVGGKLNIARQLAQETAYENDEAGIYSETPEHRWCRMRRWAEANIRS